MNQNTRRITALFFSLLTLTIGSPLLILFVTSKTPALERYEQAGRIENGNSRLYGTFCLNADTAKNNSRVDLRICDNNPGQKWEVIRLLPHGFNNNEFLVRSFGTNSCLNAYKPRSQSLVNLWTCNRNDPDQRWEIVALREVNMQQFKRAGTNLCLNAYKPRNQSLVNLWTCDKNDLDQRWKNTLFSY